MLRLDDFRLRPMTENDLEMVLNWRNQPHIREMMYKDHVISREEHQLWFEKTKDNPASVYLILEYRGRPLGQTNFTKIDREASSCMWGFYIGEDTRPRGTGTVMGFLSLDYAFENVSLREVVGEVLEHNAKSHELFERLGFTLTGRLPQHVFKNGAYMDVCVYTLTAEDWLKRHRQRIKAALRKI
ncbi:MAG: UDP-4-amino-4,6-dideoxy-N-acetyl-beta-L-altrosamine N-acetyltransferase [candidate division Zixibacteria bacterium]|nr:UDP-4-amino-4,6-dideoxy-N-acetyl-beta-L-altrosamine N-acetyltransferase [candidate division Zixibacteria bacterium]